MGMVRVIVLWLMMVVTWAAQANGLRLQHTQTENINGIQVNFPVTGNITLESGDGLLLNIAARVDMTDLQRKLRDILKPEVERRDTCGEIVELRHARLSTGSAGKMVGNVRIEYEQYHCTFAHVPQVRGFEVSMRRTRTSRVRVVETGVVGDLDFEPYILGNAEVRMRANVTQVDIKNDLVRFLADSLRVNLKNIAQRSIEKSLGRNGAVLSSVPQKVRRYVRLSEVQFSDEGGLSLHVSGQFAVTAEMVQELKEQLLSNR